jgi:hypothetical protein
MSALVDAPGVGKSRLAVEVARDASHLFHGAWWVDLGGVRDPDDVVPGLASALGVDDHSGVPVLDAVVSKLGGQRARIVFDDCEHFIDLRCHRNRHHRQRRRRHPPLSVANVIVTEGNSGTTTAIFVVTRAGNVNGISTVRAKTTNGTATAPGDYSAVASTTITFASGETAKAISVQVTTDTTFEKTETFNLVLTSPVGATISDTTATATIANDD